MLERNEEKKRKSEREKTEGRGCVVLCYFCCVCGSLLGFEEKPIEKNAPSVKQTGALHFRQRVFGMLIKSLLQRVK